MSGPILIAAGGTGGHLFPAEALSEALAARGRAILFVTDQRGKGFSKPIAGMTIARVEAATLDSRNPLALMRAGWQILRGIASAFALIGRARPAVAVGFGGYPSLPPIVAARLRGVPIVLHEQNALLGRANRMLAGSARVIASSFPALEKLAPGLASRVVQTGNPVRPAIASASGVPYAAPGAGETINLAVFGGSQGARIMSDVVPDAVAALPEALRQRVRIVQQCRPEDLERTRAAYAAAGVVAELSAFFTDVPARLTAAHLVIARSGASTCAELAAIGRPSILVPYPFAMDDHQRFNARAFASAGAAEAIAQPEFTPQRLASLISDLVQAPERLTKMADAATGLARLDAAEALARVIEGLAGAKALPPAAVEGSA
ncbi:MAG: undecaprenyldiphospho-muramoylpentapeptide beta-N-acetylglucosaminyltransferase [Alphaproteobacteria bacterium]|nr:undecaprenyldiphospho-muramoylpentapeptide beta-N-acetylglucosaminyltransferase [Alphaproteobacteria bacterium]